MDIVSVLVYSLLFSVVLVDIGAIGWGLYTSEKRRNKELLNKIEALSKPSQKAPDC